MRQGCQGWTPSFFVSGILLLALSITFAMYARSEKAVDDANDQRHLSLKLADELRQSSDDLTRMVRSYVDTGNPIYIQYYQQILDIREGRRPRPEGYDRPYWDFFKLDGRPPRPDSGQRISLMNLMMQAGFTQQELHRLEEAKLHSDALTQREFAAIELVRSADSTDHARIDQARGMLFDQEYNRRKASIMAPIDDFMVMMEARTRQAVESAAQRATMIRWLFVFLGLALMYMLWNIQGALRKTLGGSVDEVHGHITRLGRGDFSNDIPVRAGQEDSVMAWLAETRLQLQQMEEKRKENEQQLRIAATAFETQEGMMITDADRNIIRVNRAFTEITGYGMEEVLGRNPSLLSSGRHDKDFFREIYLTLGREGHWQGEIFDRHKDGHIYPKWLSITTVRDDSTQITHYVGSFADITERKAAEEKILNLAFYDTLTALPNRRLLMERLGHAIAKRTRIASHGALLFLDLDNFKALNDTQGHQVGDELLVEVAGRLTACVREADTVARLGGDEFIVLLDDLDEPGEHAAIQAQVVAEKILVSLNRPYLLSTGQFHCSTSIGIVLFVDPTTPPDTLLSRADTAMYAAKKGGKNTFRFFDPAMQHALEHRTELESALRQAITGEQLRLHYQVQTDALGRTLGMEALVRWQHPRQGLLVPGNFIPLAEETGIILDIGRWVLKTACDQLGAWQVRSETRHLTMAVNVSTRQFYQTDFVAQVKAAITTAGGVPTQLKLELTESMVLQDMDNAIAKMGELKALGVILSMDDFGTGYSSLSYLKNLPFDQIKIDKSFVQGIESNRSDALIVHSIINLGKTMGMHVVAEGVETAAQLELLKEMGCTEFQGYYFGKPRPVEHWRSESSRPAGPPASRHNSAAHQR
ncbi:putative bifunctional diguanylate cyclase/phosphodiesterase [Denitratisoma oestradiolicum]|nr:EAL domain-containing protein [Denitratisoma oestradiolicum]